MLFNYNSIPMKMTKTNNIQFDAIFTEDKVAYLYTHYIIDIQAVVNPKTMAYTSDDTTGEPMVTPGTFPATTIKAIRHALMQPRMQLIVTDEAGNALLSTPDMDMLSDAKVGPVPISCSIVNVTGARTVIINWKCEGWIRECPEEPSIAPYILANRWTDQMVINEYQLTTRTFTGVTIFNRALLDNDNTTPDQFRGFIFPDTGLGFKRKNVEIAQSMDGTELMWRVTDEELVWFLGDTTPDISGDGPPLTTDGFDTGILEVEGVQAVVGFKPPDATPALAGATINQIQLRAKGSFYANQWIMIQRLVEIAGTLTPELLSAGAALDKAYYVMDASIRRSLGQKEKWVELSLAIMCPALETSTVLLGNLNLMAINYDIWYAIDTIIDQTAKESPPLLRDSNSRGSALEFLLSNILTNACTDYEFTNDLPTKGNARTKKRVPRKGISRSEVKLGVSSKVSLVGAGESGSTLGDTGTSDIIEYVPSKYDINSIGDSLYTIYTIEVFYRSKTGIKQIPITGPTPATSQDPTCGLVQLHLPITQLEYTGVAERVNSFPTMPSPVPNDPESYVLLDWHLSPFYAAPGYDGVTPVYRCDFYYKYALVSGLDPTTPLLQLGKLPFSLFPAEVRGGDDFSPDILGI